MTRPGLRADGVRPTVPRTPRKLRRRRNGPNRTAKVSVAERAALPAGAGTAPPLERAEADRGAAAFAPAKPRAAGRAIPAAVKRQVWERDQGRCSYVDRDSGRRCGSRYLLQVDHVFPYALGGSAEPDNLRLLCAAHHRHRHRHAGRAARRNE